MSIMNAIYVALRESEPRNTHWSYSSTINSITRSLFVYGRLSLSLYRSDYAATTSTIHPVAAVEIDLFIMLTNVGRRQSITGRTRPLVFEPTAVTVDCTFP